MKVGFRATASPRTPGASLRPESVSVCGVPYPTAPPNAKMTASAATSMMCASGRYAMYTSVGVKRPASMRPAQEAITDECGSITPFGGPVVPDVYMMTATSLGLGGLGATTEGADEPAATRASKVDTLMSGRTVVRDSICDADSVPNTTKWVAVGQEGAHARMKWNSLASAITTGASVWRSPWLTPSSPSVAYTVTTVPFWRHTACAATWSARV